MLESFKKFSIKNIKRAPLYFFVLAAIISATFFLLALEKHKFYQSQVSVLFIPKSEKAALQSEQIVNNLISVSKNLSFYEKILEDNIQIRNLFEGYSKAEQRKLWRKTLKIEAEENSSIINIKIIAGNRLESAQLSFQTAHTLFNTASRYYDIKKDIDLRVVEGPIIDLVIKNWFRLVFLSVLAGIISSFTLLFLMDVALDILRKIFREKRLALPKETFDFFKFPAIAEGKKEPEKEKKSGPFSVPAATRTPFKKSAAPKNLPVAAGEDWIKENFQEIYKFDRKKDEGFLAGELRETREPTEEELKERLNQLLRGEL